MTENCNIQPNWSSFPPGPLIFLLQCSSFITFGCNFLFNVCLSQAEEPVNFFFLITVGCPTPTELLIQSSAMAVCWMTERLKNQWTNGMRPNDQLNHRPNDWMIHRLNELIDKWLKFIIYIQLDDLKILPSMTKDKTAKYSFLTWKIRVFGDGTEKLVLTILRSSILSPPSVMGWVIIPYWKTLLT